MSITSDIRSYADSAINTAVTQGKQSFATAQAQFADVSGTVSETANKYAGTAQKNVSEIAEKASEAVNEVLAGAEKAINADALRTAIEPYLAQAREYSTAVTDRAEELLATLRSDPRVEKLLAQADAVGGVVVEQVNERIVTPVRSLTGLGGKPAKRTAPSPRPRKAAPTKPAGKPAAKSASTGPARKSSTGSTAKKTTTARKTAAKRTPQA